MARFSKAETEYLGMQQIARIATVSPAGQPDLVPVVLEFDGEYFWVGSHNERPRKYKNVKSGNKLVAIKSESTGQLRSSTITEKLDLENISE